jgi:hypothetical protein
MDFQRVLMKTISLKLLVLKERFKVDRKWWAHSPSKVAATTQVVQMDVSGLF